MAKLIEQEVLNRIQTTNACGNKGNPSLSRYLLQVGHKLMIRTKWFIAAFAMVGLLLCGCNQSQRRLSGGYSLERFDEGGTSYYVTASGEAINGGGVFDGTVQEIGWNKDWILARITRLYQGDSNGWYVLNLKTSLISGPVPDTDLKTNLAFSSIKMMRPAEVFAGK